MRKADEFADAAALLHDSDSGSADAPDAYVTLAVHAGIAAADVICIRRGLGYNASGNHEESLKLLEKGDREAVKHLRRLLAVKTKAGYSTNSVSAADVRSASAAHLALLELARATR
ncbi:hypothetical protein NVV95_03615 [Herbiconiux sp. CPCC 205716]|uniref:HEPN domain-containing protein n=1 Tax=Herbiconiux gentiana TaxID=2970912 RepID=A0ABT2GFQ5_9MICO|nr:hypothetical protein [Herbiconiux gentiana]MCS5713641.1 hypothetical protein [Herbiconiux gentiana]